LGKTSDIIRTKYVLSKHIQIDTSTNYTNLEEARFQSKLDSTSDTCQIRPV